MPFFGVKRWGAHEFCHQSRTQSTLLAQHLFNGNFPVGINDCKSPSSNPTHQIPSPTFPIAKHISVHAFSFLYAIFPNHHRICDNALYPAAPHDLFPGLPSQPHPNYDTIHSMHNIHHQARDQLGRLLPPKPLRVAPPHYRNPTIDTTMITWALPHCHASAYVCHQFVQCTATGENPQQ